tara:strand:- start:95 stop:256 length:162 start_codon:yes stop_codon:yes gene_type:complete
MEDLSYITLLAVLIASVAAVLGIFLVRKRRNQRNKISARLSGEGPPDDLYPMW